MTIKNSLLFKIIVINIFVLTSPICFLSGVNVHNFEFSDFKNGLVDNEKIEDVIKNNPKTVKRHLKGLEYVSLPLGLYMTKSNPTHRAIILWAVRSTRNEALQNILVIVDKNPTLKSDFLHAINYQDPTTWNTPLHAAVAKKNISLVEMLLEHEADRFITNKQGDTPLHQAAKNNKLEIVKMLVKGLEKKRQHQFIEVKNKKNKTALDLAPENSDLEEYFKKIVNPAKIEEKKEEKDDEEAKRLAEEKRLAQEEAKKKKDKIDIQDNQLEDKLEKLSESLSKLKSKLGALKNSLGQLKKNLDEKSGPLAMDSSEELAKQEADKKKKKEQEKLKAGVIFNQIPTTKLLKFPRKTGGAKGRRLPTKNLKNKLQKLKLESEKLQTEIEEKDEKADLERQKTIENLTKFKADLKFVTSHKKPLSKVSLQAILQQNKLIKHFTNLDLMFDKNVTVDQFIKVIDQEIADLSMQMGLE